MRGNASDPSPHFGRRGPGAIGRGVGGAYAIGVAERSRSEAGSSLTDQTAILMPDCWILMLGRCLPKLYFIIDVYKRRLVPIEYLPEAKQGLFAVRSLHVSGVG